MDNTVIIALITLVGVLASAFFSYLASKRQHDVTIALLEQRLSTLERKMDLHNNAVVRLTQAEVEIKNLKEKVK